MSSPRKRAALNRAKAEVEALQLRLQLTEWRHGILETLAQSLTQLTNSQASEIVNLTQELAVLKESSAWRPMGTAPKDGSPILAWCLHKADPYFLDDGNRLTVYGAHAEGLSHAQDGYRIVQWGGEYFEEDSHIPDWWFVVDTDFEVVANPVAWSPLSPPDMSSLHQEKETEE